MKKKTGAERGEIRVWIEDFDGEVLEDLGTVITNSPNRALQMFNEDENRWANKGYSPDICWRYTD